VAYWLAIWFGCGRAPLAPGTVGTLGALPVYYLAARGGPLVVLATGVALTVVGIWASSLTARLLRSTDPQVVVVDEVAGVMLTLAMAPAGWKGVVTGVVLFRLFDQTKPWPARALSRLPGGFGIVLDDVAAAVWAGAVLVAAQVVGWL
jgi:phosphatidylglycerophosphatase A